MYIIIIMIKRNKKFGKVGQKSPTHPTQYSLYYLDDLIHGPDLIKVNAVIPPRPIPRNTT